MSIMNHFRISKMKAYLDNLCRTGFDKERNVIKQKLVYTSNAICLLSFFVCLIMAVLKFILLGNYFESIATLMTGIFLLMFMYLNKAGYSLAGRVSMPVAANLILLIISVIFTHNSYLDIYFLFICNTTLQLFDYSERKWAYLSTGFSILCLLIETTGLQNYLPAYNLISAESIDDMNMVLIVGIVIFAIIQARIFVIVSKFKEVDLTSTQSILKSSQTDLQKQNEELESFGIAVTHDLKAPISIAHLYLNLINRHVKKKYQADADLNDFVDMVHTSLGQMEKLIMAYLTFNKVKSVTMDKEILNVNEELYSIVKNSLNKVVNRDVILPEIEISIRSNKYLFPIVMKNVIENGLKYNKSAHPRVIIGASKKKDSIVFTISDNGIGIDPKFLKYLFEPFKRYNVEIEGSGLGLTVAKRAAEKLGGSLICHHTGKDGTVFLLELPL